MATKLVTAVVVSAFFCAGVVFGKQIQKLSHGKKTKHAGTLQIYQGDTTPQLYLALDVPIESLLSLSEVIFIVQKIK